ncbi:MAG: VWA domain-containing protein, partial [Desulfobacterales bacterium]
MIQTKDGKTSKSRLYVQDTQYRMDMQERGTKFFLLVDRKEGITRVVFPADREYMDMETTSKPSLMNNPFESFRQSARQYERKEKGQESFKGFECSKVLVRSGEQELFTAWISEELGFPLKIVFHLQKGMSAELDNIQQSKVDKSLFKVPEDYAAMKGPGSGAAKQKKDQRPEKEPWMDRVSSAEVLEPPVKKGDMEEGEIFRVKIEPDKALSTFTSGGVRIYAFKQGQPVVKFVYSGGRLKVYLSPEEADEIVLYNPSDSRFRDHARVKQGEMPERVLAAGEEMRIRMKPGDESVARFVNMADSESKVYYTWLSQGRELPESELAPKHFRTKTLRAGKNFRSTFNQLEGKASGDTLLVQVQKGRVLVKAGQPFQPKTVADTVQKPAESKPEPARTKEKSTSSVETAQKTKQNKGSAKAWPTEAQTAKQSTSRAANIMFILDASGSMWGEIEGRDKIAIAKEVMAGLIRDLPDNTRAGLVAYGHRRKRDCKDVEELVQISPLDKEGIIRTIQGLSPKGKTPITYSVRVTAEKLRVLEDETTIILVSDGKESCEGDPCALVKELKESGLRFVMHVIGFDVGQEGRKQLECMAEAGGGRYFTAKTAGQFEAAAREVVQETKTVGFLEIMAFRNETPVRARVEVFKQDTGQRVKKLNTALDEKKPEIIRLKPGTYKVVFTDEGLPDNPSRSFSDVKIELDQTVSKTARFDAGILELSAIKEGKSIHAHARLYKKDDLAASGWLEEGKGAAFSLSPGVYRVEVTDKSIPEEPVVSLKDIEIKSGQSISKQANFSREGELKIEALRENKSIHVHAEVYKGDERVASGWLEEGKGASFKLLPGVYRVELQDKKIPQQPVVVL